MVSSAIASMLTESGYPDFIVVTTGEESIEEVSDDPPDLVLMDIILSKEINGVEAAQRIRAQHPFLPIIFITGVTDSELFNRALLLADAYLTKPFSLEQLAYSIHMVLERKRMQGRITHLIQVLRSIRDINHLIIEEKSREPLLTQSCRLLVETRGYLAAMVIRPLQEGGYALDAAAGFSQYEEDLRRHLSRHASCSLIDAALASPAVSLEYDRTAMCPLTELAHRLDAGQVAAVALRCAEECFGVLLMATQPEQDVDNEEQALMTGVAADLAVALSAIELEQRRKAVAAALEESEQKHRHYLSENPCGVIIADAEGRCLDVNPAACAITGYMRDELLHLRVEDLMSVNAGEQTTRNLEKVKLEGRQTVEAAFRHRDGSIRWWRINAVKLSDDRFIGFVSDITEKRAMQERLRFMSFALDHAPDPMFIVRRDAGFSYVNAEAAVRLGYQHDELMRMRVPQVDRHYEDGAWELLWSDLLVQGQSFIRTSLRTREGRELPVEMKLSMFSWEGETYLSAFAWDMSESLEQQRHRESLERQLLQAQKLEALGRLAGGVAHDFNNLLTVITGNLTFLMQGVKRNDSMRLPVEEIAKASGRATAIVRQLLAFSRRQIIESTTINLKELLDGLSSMLERLIGEDIHLQLSCHEQVGCVRADPGQIEQVIVNLCVNARDAMPDGGTITIETADVTLDEQYSQRYPDVAPGQYVMLAISDTGGGIPEEVLPHIFDPFFTTKSEDHGTGLGLATSYGIVKQHGGFIAVASSHNAGACFRVYLPRCDQVLPSIPRFTPSETDLPLGSETILVVEDEALVRDVVLRLLKRLGYRVLEASDGAAAIALVQTSDEPIDMLMTDVVMPGINGRVLAQRLLALRPQIKVLYTSGYTDDVVVQRGVLDSHVHFLGKPYTPRMLAQKLRQVLDNG